MHYGVNLISLLVSGGGQYSEKVNTGLKRYALKITFSGNFVKDFLL